MAKKTQLLGNLTEFPSYRDGEIFFISVPEDPLTLELKKGKNAEGLSGINWDPWPKEDGVIRLGRFFLRRDSKYSWVSRWDGNKYYERLIAEADENGQPGQWMRYDWRPMGAPTAKKFPCYHGERGWEVLSARALQLTDVVERVKEEIQEEIQRWVIAENFKAGDEKHTAKERAWLFEDKRVAERVLKTPEGQVLREKFEEKALGPYDITEEEIRKVFKIKAGTPLSWDQKRLLSEEKRGHWEFQYRENLLKIEAEWARLQLMKLQRKIRREQKKKIMAERNLDAEALAAEKAERKRMERRVKRTEEWVKVSKDIHNSIDWLQEFVRRMGKFEKIDQKWFDENRRELRKLATKMKPLSRVLND